MRILNCSPKQYYDWDSLKLRQISKLCPDMAYFAKDNSDSVIKIIKYVLWHYIASSAPDLSAMLWHGHRRNWHPDISRLWQNFCHLLPSTYKIQWLDSGNTLGSSEINHILSHIWTLPCFTNQEILCLNRVFLLSKIKIHEPAFS